MLNNSFLNNNLSDTTSFTDQLDVLIISSFFYILIFVTGVIGNLLVVYVLFKEKELKNFTNFLLANLSIADLMVLFTCVPTGFIIYLTLLIKILLLQFLIFFY